MCLNKVISLSFHCHCHCSQHLRTLLPMKGSLDSSVDPRQAHRYHPGYLYLVVLCYAVLYVTAKVTH